MNRNAAHAAFGALTLALAVALTGCASPRTAPDAPPNAAECADVGALGAGQLYGSWEVELPQAGLRGRLTLRQHPEFSASLRGEFDYGGQHSIASGDVEGGEFNLDESRDGKSLYAFWSGQLVPAACGAEIRGRWEPVAKPGKATPASSDFILRRSAGAQAW